MPYGPNGQWRPSGIARSHLVCRIAVGEAPEVFAPEPGSETAGSEGGKARAEKLTSEERSEIARRAAKNRWNR